MALTSQQEDTQAAHAVAHRVRDHICEIHAELVRQRDELRDAFNEDLAGSDTRAEVLDVRNTLQRVINQLKALL